MTAQTTASGEEHSLPTLDPLTFPDLGKFEPNSFAHTFVEVGEAWASAAAALELLEEGRKVVLAKLVQKHQAEGYNASAKGLSRQAAEDRALADPEYKSFLLKLRSHRERANQLRVRWDSCKMYVELVRSKMATDRAEMMIR